MNLLYNVDVKEFLTKLGIGVIAALVVVALAAEYWIWRMETYVSSKMSNASQSINDAINDAMKREFGDEHPLPRSD